MTCVDLRHKPSEVLTLTVGIQRCLIGPLFNEDEMPRVFLINVQVVSNTVGLQTGFFHQFGVPGAHLFEVFRFDEVFSNDFQHVDCPCTHLSGFDLVRFKTIGAGHLPHALIKLAIDLARQQFAGLEEHVQLREQFDFGGRQAPHQMFGGELCRVF